MKIEILKVENGKIVEPEFDDMTVCIMGGCSGGGGAYTYINPYQCCDGG